MAPGRPRVEQEEAETGMGASSSPTSTPREGPSGDTAFMEQVLLELSAQNEHAREEQERAAPSAPDTLPPRPRTVRVERDSEFRTPEGVPSARAYLPARTLAPGRSEPIDPDRVHVADPRKLPTVRIARPRGDASRKERPAPASSREPSSEPTLDWSSPVPDETAPTLRSASPQLARLRPPETRRWIGWVLFAAVAGVLLVALMARLRATTERPSPPPDRRSAAQLVPSTADPSVPPSAGARATAPVPRAPASTGGPSAPAVSAPGTSEPAVRPHAAPKSDRWF